MSNVVFELFAKLGLDSSEYEEGLNDAKDKASSIGGVIAGGLKTVGKAGVAVGAAVATATVAAGTALVKGAGDVAAYGDNIDKMSQKMGISAQAYQEWDAIMQHSGTSIEALKPSMKTLANAAEKGNEAFQKLGISEEEVASLSQEDLFAKVITGLQGMEEGTERTYLTSQLLGRGATELGALLNTSAEDTEKMRQRVHELGGVMSDEAVKAAAAYQDSLQDMKTGLDGLKRGLVSEFLPSITEVMDGLTNIFSGDYESGLTQISEGVTTLIENLTSKLPEVIKVGGDIIGAIGQGIIDNLPAIIDAAVQIIVMLVQGLIQALPELANGAITLITSLGQALYDNAGTLLEAGAQLLQFIWDGIQNNLTSLVESGGEIVGNLANGFLEKLPSMIEAAGDMVNKMLDYFLKNYPKFLETGVKLLLNIVNGIVNNLPKIIEAVLKVITQFIATITQNLPKILEQGIIILGKLIAGLLQAIPQLIAAIPQIIRAIVDTFGSFDWASIGWNLLEGIKNGILDAVGAVVDAAREAAGAIWDSITGFFDINSPSKRMAWVGEMIDRGLAKGIDSYSDLVDDAVEDITDIKGITAEANINANTVNGATPSNNVIINVYGAVGQPVEELAEIVSEKINNATGRRMIAMGVNG